MSVMYWYDGLRNFCPVLYDRFLYELNRCYIYLCIYLFSDPCFAKECSQSERCRVTSGDKTTCSKFDISRKNVK